MEREDEVEEGRRRRVREGALNEGERVGEGWREKMRKRWEGGGCGKVRKRREGGKEKEGRGKMRGE